MYCVSSVCWSGVAIIWAGAFPGCPCQFPVYFWWGADFSIRGKVDVFSAVVSTIQCNVNIVTLGMAFDVVPVLMESLLCD